MRNVRWWPENGGTHAHARKDDARRTGRVARGPRSGQGAQCPERVAGGSSSFRSRSKLVAASAAENCGADHGAGWARFVATFTAAAFAFSFTTPSSPSCPVSATDTDDNNTDEAAAAATNYCRQ